VNATDLENKDSFATGTESVGYENTGGSDSFKRLARR
jgi:hypothetical protein